MYVKVLHHRSLDGRGMKKKSIEEGERKLKFVLLPKESFIFHKYDAATAIAL